LLSARVFSAGTIDDESEIPRERTHDKRASLSGRLRCRLFVRRPAGA
jgi:hypothetical protein